MRAIVVSGCDAGTAVVRRAALAAGLACGPDDCVSYRGLAARLTTAAADLVLIDVGVPAAAAAVEYAARHTGAAVFAVGPAADGELVLRTLRYGARGYLDAGRLGEDLPAALPGLAAADRPGRSIAVVTAVPGAGATTLAAALAFALVGGGRRVAVAELGAGPPALAASLAVRPRHALADLTAEGARVDAGMARQAAVPHPAGVHVLAHAPDAFPPAGHARDAVAHLAAAVRAAFDVAVLDLGHDPAAWPAVAPAADAVVVVARLDVVGVRLTRLALDRLAADGVRADRIFVAANRCGRRGELGRRAVEAALGRTVAAWLPDAPGAVNAAAARGLPVTKSRWSAVSRGVRRLARALETSFPPAEARP